MRRHVFVNGILIRSKSGERRELETRSVSTFAVSLRFPPRPRPLLLPPSLPPSSSRSSLRSSLVRGLRLRSTNLHVAQSARPQTRSACRARCGRRCARNCSRINTHRNRNVRSRPFHARSGSSSASHCARGPRRVKSRVEFRSSLSDSYKLFSLSQRDESIRSLCCGRRELLGSATARKCFACDFKR